jgi:methylated-DNA-[protein]-cysteine S-methyltransferase
MAYYLFDTAIGRCGLAWSDAGLCAVQLPEADAQATERRLQRKHGASQESVPTAEVAACTEKMQAYFDGAEVDFADVALDWSGVTAFNAEVYRLLRAVPYGRMLTYGEMAKRAGQPRGAQAIGAAMGSNPWPIVVPCHRVVAGSGRLGGFSAHGGNVLKRRLLLLEGATHEEEAPLLPGMVGRSAVDS